MTKKDTQSGKPEQFISRLILARDVDNQGRTYYTGTYGTPTDGTMVILKIGHIIADAQVIADICDDSTQQEGKC